MTGENADALSDREMFEKCITRKWPDCTVPNCGFPCLKTWGAEHADAKPLITPETWPGLVAYPGDAENADAKPRCGAVVGPVWKAGGESWICILPIGHDGDHDGGDGTWWVENADAK